MLQIRSSTRRLTLIALALFIAPIGAAQTVMGTILGTVIDPAGASVPGAQVAIENTGTNLQRAVLTNDRGEYYLADLPVGNYSVTVGHPGFKTDVRKGVTLTVGASLTINFSLSIGDTAQSVEVSADTTQVETATSSMGGFVAEKTIRDLPLNGRDWLRLTTLQPGVLEGQAAKDGSRGWGIAIAINGARPNNAVYHVDGLVVNDMSNAGPGSILGVNLGVDGIQEYKVLTSSYSAEYGRSGGGVVNAILKSGTNQFHGSAVEFTRNSALDARNFFDQGVLPFQRNQFGGSIGGPVKRNRLFFFANYEGLQQSQTRTSISQTLTDAARNGNLVSGTVAVAATAKPYLGLYPSPNGVINGDTGQFISAGDSQGKQNYVAAKVDYSFSPATNLSVSYTHDVADNTSPDGFRLKYTTDDSRTQMVSLTLTHIFMPTLIGTGHLGVYRHHDDSAKPETAGSIPALRDTALGFFPNVPMGSISVTGLSGISGVNIVATSIDGYTAPQGSYDLSWTRGRNNFKFGSNIERIDSNEGYSVNNIGQWTFTSVSSFLQGKPSAFTGQAPGTDVARGMRMTVAGGYVQDDFHVNRHLMLNLGLRYEISTVIKEAHDKLANLVNLTDPQMTVGKPLYQNPTLRNFAPRVGIAWDVNGDGKTAVRAGAGIFDLLPLPYIIENRIDRTYPFYDSISLSNPPATAFPNNVLQFRSPTTARVVSIETNPKRSTMLQYNLNVQRQLARDVALTVGFVGSAGVHLPVGTDDADVVSPTLAKVGPGGFVTFPTGAGTPQRLNPAWGRISTIWWMGHSTYHGLNVNLTKRFSGGSSFQVAYTWANSIDDGDGTYSESQNSNSAVTPYPFFWRLNRGPSDFDVRQNLVLSYSWEIPVPATWARTARAIAGGWQVSGIVTARTGLPATISLSNDQANTGTSSSGSGTNPSGQRPNYNPAGCPNGQTNPGNIYSYINFSCYSFPTLGTLGNLGRGTLRSPIFTNADVSLAKNFGLFGEKIKGQFRAESFNFLNHTSFGLNGAKIFSGTGTIVASTGQLATRSNGRQIQLGVRIVF